jgi:hypothetical protein
MNQHSAQTHRPRSVDKLRSRIADEIASAALKYLGTLPPEQRGSVLEMTFIPDSGDLHIQTFGEDPPPHGTDLRHYSPDGSYIILDEEIDPNGTS